MRAVYFEKTGAIENLEIGEVPEPRKLEAHEVRLRFIAGSLNHLDLWVLKGLPRVQYSFPHIPGADLCGEVIESKSPLFQSGQRVLLYPAESEGKDPDGKTCPENLCPDFRIRSENAPGVFCAEINVHERYLVKAPEHLEPEEAASLPLVYLTAWQMVTEKAEFRLNEISKDEVILVHGAGSGVSQALLQILHSFKASNVVVTSRDPKKLEDWIKRGFQGFTLSDSLETQLKDHSHNKGFSVIFDHVGQKHFELNLRLLRKGGRFITCGATSGPEGHLDLRQLYFRQLRLLGSTMGTLKQFFSVIQWIDQQKLTPKISHRFRFHDVQKAYQLMEEGLQTGKIILSES